MDNEITSPGDGIFSEEEWKAIAHRLQLSKRALEIARASFSHKKEAAIADDIRISLNTLRTYRQRIYHKLKVNSRHELVLRIIQAGRTLLSVLVLLSATG